MKKQFFIGCTIGALLSSSVLPSFSAPAGHEVTGSLTTSSEQVSSGLAGEVAVTVTPATLSTVSTISGTTTAASSVTVSGSAISFSTGSNIRVTLPAGTIITPAGGGTFDTTAITTTAASVTSGLSANEVSNGAVEFGISSVSLHFNKPIKIEIPVPSVTAATIAVKVKHGGTTTFVTNGLTNSASSTCLSGVPSVPSNIATVSNGVATIYSCAASTFVAVGVTTTSGGGGGGGGSSPIVISNTPVVTASGTIQPNVTIVPTATQKELDTLIQTVAPYIPPVVIDEEEIAFKDIEMNWARVYIQKVAVRGIVNNGDTFNPEGKLTRAEFLKMVLNAAGVSTTGSYTIPYSDVASSHTLARFIAVAASKGIISKTTKNFRPNDPITRAEAMKIVLNVLGADVSNIKTISFEDVSSTSDLAKYIEKAKLLQIVSGQGTKFRPNDSITRAEITKVVVNTFKL